MDFREAMELIAVNCTSRQYCHSETEKCPMLRFGYNGERYCLLEAPLPHDVDEICEAVEVIKAQREKFKEALT